MNDVIQMIAADLLIPVKELRHTIAFAALRNRKFMIRKRSGGYRTIVQPSVKLKPVLSWLDSYVFSKLPVHKIATAFRPGISILENVEAHTASKYSVRVDISNFFPSIVRNDLTRVLEENVEKLPSWACETETLAFISRVCFDREGRLPIGYSTSPSIANAVMYKIDCQLADSISGEAEFGNAALTRYADDFVFSSDREGTCNAFLTMLAKTLSENISPKLVINDPKTRFMSKAGGSMLITGLRINNQSNVVVHANYRDHVRLLLKLFKQQRLKMEDIAKLTGHIAYVQHVDPALFTKLSFKFHEEISHLRSQTNIKS